MHLTDLAAGLIMLSPQKPRVWVLASQKIPTFCSPLKSLHPKDFARDPNWPSESCKLFPVFHIPSQSVLHCLAEILVITLKNGRRPQLPMNS